LYAGNVKKNNDDKCMHLAILLISLLAVFCILILSKTKLRALSKKWKGEKMTNVLANPLVGEMDVADEYQI
jgi:hypothetical protein